ncbi:MAG: HAD family hydrolase [Euryarchaeota archaeon]|nr:HAD family hydrolase [Euryarchaeota archaeon]MBU4139496.1 HAD family hydrolase [Euryarchaeota archaeon]
MMRDSIGNMEIKSILFDMDNTLFDFIEAKYAACEAIVEHLGLKDSRELFKYFLRGVYNFEAWENIMDYMKDRGVYSEQVYLECCDLYERKKLEAIDPYPNVLETLHQLKKMGFSLGVVTDAHIDHARSRLMKTRLFDLFDVLVTADMTGTKKPSPEIFFKTLEKLQITPDQALYIGDSLRRDIEPARKIGMVTAYAAYGDRNVKEDRSCQADYCLNDISDVFKFLDSKNAQSNQHSISEKCIYRMTSFPA